MTSTLHSHLRVRRSLLDMEQVESDLYVLNLNYQKKVGLGYALAKNDYPGLCLWEEDGDFVILPRGYAPPFKDPRDYMRFQDLRPTWPHVDGFCFTKELRSNQNEPVAALLRPTPGLTNDKLLCLGCGKGKTVIALWYAVAKSKKTIVIVDRDFLITQWQKQITGVLGIDTDSIGLIKEKTFHIGEQITIASIATLRKKLDELPAEFYDQFGLVVVDEAHLLGAPEAMRVLPNFPGERLLLTATPVRKDGMHPAFMLHGGGLEPCYTDLTRDQSSRWVFIELDEVLQPEALHGVYTKRPGWPRPRLLRPRYETRAGESFEFNMQILNDVFRAEQSGRNVLVLGSRVEQLSLLTQASIDAGADAALVVGSVKGEVRDEAFKHQVIYATWQIAGRALDIDRLDTLVLLYPNDDEGFLRQAVGRVDRLLEGKRQSVVVVFSHVAHASLARKAASMRETILEIDPGAQVSVVRRRWKTPRNGNLGSMLVGETRNGTASTPGRTLKVTRKL